MTTTTTIYLDHQSDPAGWAYRTKTVTEDCWGHDDVHAVPEESGPIDTLDDLLAVLRDGGELKGTVGMTALPTFGGDDCADIGEDPIWSWDSDRVLIGTCADDFEIVPRWN